jgi:hypothetical protein
MVMSVQLIDLVICNSRITWYEIYTNCHEGLSFSVIYNLSMVFYEIVPNFDWTLDQFDDLYLKTLTSDEIVVNS